MRCSRIGVSSRSALAADAPARPDDPLPQRLAQSRSRSRRRLLTVQDPGLAQVAQALGRERAPVIAAAGMANAASRDGVGVPGEAGVGVDVGVVVLAPGRHEEGGQVQRARPRRVSGDQRRGVARRTAPPRQRRPNTRCRDSSRWCMRLMRARPSAAAARPSPCAVVAVDDLLEDEDLGEEQEVLLAAGRTRAERRACGRGRPCRRSACRSRRSRPCACSPRRGSGAGRPSTSSLPSPVQPLGQALHQGPLAVDVQAEEVDRLPEASRRRGGSSSASHARCRRARSAPGS